MHFIFTGTQQEGTEVKVSQLMDTLHESRCTIYNQGEASWARSTDDHIVNWCPAEDVHNALDLLGLRETDMTVVCCLQSSASLGGIDELLGSLLRASYCHNARVIIISNSTDRTWLHDYVPVSVVPEVSDIKPLLWRGDLWLDDLRCCGAELYQKNEDSSMQRSDFHGCSYMELVTSVKASSVHACMLGDSFEVKLLPIGDTSLSITSDQETAHIVRTVSCETLDDEDDDDERFMQKHNIGTADSWMTYVLQDKLIRPNYKHPGPAKYEYYMLSGGDGHVMMYQIQLEKLSEHLVTREFFNPAPDRLFDESTESIYNSICTDPFPDEDLPRHIQSLQIKIDSFKHDVQTSFTELLTKPDHWRERRVLEDLTNRRNVVARKRDKKNGVDTETAQEACCKSLDTICSYFDESGIPKDSKYWLPSGNRESSEVLTTDWPNVYTVYGPGISYHHKDDPNLDHRLIMYRDRGFPETASLFSADVIHKVVKKSKPKTPQKNSRKTPRKSAKVTAVRKSPRGKAPLNHSLKAAAAGDNGSSPPIVDTKREGAQLPPLAATNITAPSSRASSVTSETSQTDIRPSAGASKAARNQKNLMKVRKAVKRALYHHGITQENAQYKDYSAELFELAMVGIKKLKTSEHLEKRMKEIAEVYVTPAIMAVDMRKKQETKSSRLSQKTK